MAENLHKCSDDCIVNLIFIKKFFKSNFLNNFRVTAQLGHSFGYFTVVTDLPKYMADVLKFNIKENGLYSTLPYVAMWIMSILFGSFSDWMLTKKWLSITNSRKLFTTLSFTIPGIFLVVASFSGCNRMLAVSMFTIAMGFMGAYYSGMKANNLDLSPNFAGAIMALTNGIGAIVGIINVSLCLFNLSFIN